LISARKAGERDVEAIPCTRSDVMVKYFSRILLLIAGSGVLSNAQDEKAGTVPRFESEIRPIFAANCLTCHGSQMQQAGLDLRDRDSILKGGRSGPAIQRGLPESSLLLEKEHYPRFKLCAGGLVTDAEVILKKLGLDASEVPHVDVENAHFDFAGKGINIRVPGKHAIRVIRRSEFDAWLAQKTREAGIEILEGVTVKNVTPDQEGVTVETDQGIFRAQIVVGADGSNGVTRRCILPNDPLQTARVLEIITPTNDVIASPEPQTASGRSNLIHNGEIASSG
jgi:hypothetical protein